MDRRGFVKYLGATVGSSILTGCFDRTQDGTVVEGDVLDYAQNIGRATEGHPWAGESLTVSLEQVASAQNGINEGVQEATQYWSRNASTYAGFDVDLNYRPNSDSRDMVVYTVTNPGDVCGGPAQGCAPLIDSRWDYAPNPARVRIANEESGWRWSFSKIAKHEIGHTLGLTHDDEPHEIMSYEGDDRDRSSNYRTRTRIYNNYYAGVRRVSQAYGIIEEASSYYETGDYRQASQRYSTAQEYLREAEGYFDQAGSLAGRINLRGVKGDCNTATGATQNLRFAASRYSDSSDALIRGNRQRAEQLRREGSNYQSDFNPSRVTHPREIKGDVILPRS